MRGGYVLFPPIGRDAFKTRILTTPAAFIGNGQFGFVFQNEYIIKLIFVGRAIGALNIVFKPPERPPERPPVRVGRSTVVMLDRELSCYQTAYTEGLRRFRNTLTPTILANFRLTKAETVAYLQQQDPTFELPPDVEYTAMIIMENAGINVGQILHDAEFRFKQLKEIHEAQAGVAPAGPQAGVASAGPQADVASVASRQEVVESYADYMRLKDDFYPKIRRLLICLLQIGIIHGDHTLENIMFNPQDDQFRLIDFGMSTLLNEVRQGQATEEINTAERSGDWDSVFKFIYANSVTGRASGADKENHPLFRWLYTFPERGSKMPKNTELRTAANRVVPLVELFPTPLPEDLVAQLIKEASALEKFAGGKLRTKVFKRKIRRTRRAKQRAI